MEKEIYIDLNFKTSKAFSKNLFESVLHYLLHYREQIPFNFVNFQQFIMNKNVDNKCFKKTAQVRKAKETYDKICSIKEVNN
jgi:hypothetical protein